jgi:hypothetical protein
VRSKFGLVWWAATLVWFGGQQLWFGLVGNNGLFWWQQVWFDLVRNKFGLVWWAESLVWFSGQLWFGLVAVSLA